MQIAKARWSLGLFLTWLWFGRQIRQRTPACTTPPLPTTDAPGKAGTTRTHSSTLVAKHFFRWLLRFFSANTKTVPTEKFFR